MSRLTQWLYELDLPRVWTRFYRDVRGQDMVEYALMAAFVAVASAAVLPSVSPGINTVLSKVGSVLSVAAAS